MWQGSQSRCRAVDSKARRVLRLWGKHASTHAHTQACAACLSRRPLWLHRFRFGAPSRPRRIPRHRRAPPTRSRRRRRSRPRPTPTASLRSKRWSSEARFSRLRRIRTPPHLHRDRAHPCHICTGTGLTPATSAQGLARARAWLAATRLAQPSSCAGACSDRRCGAGPILLEPTSGVDVGGVSPVPVPM